MSFKKFRPEYLLVLVIVISFILLQPKLSSVLFPQKRADILNTFLTTTKEKKGVDARSFWYFREFYYPGSFSLNKTGFDPAEYRPFLNSVEIDINSDTQPNVFLIYNSDKISSIEMIVNNGVLDKIMTRVGGSNAEVIHQDDTSIIERGPNSILVIFSKPTSEMIKANGYFDFKNPRDRVIIENKYWLSISKISID